MNDKQILAAMRAHNPKLQFLPSFPSALQLGVTFGLLNNLPPFFPPSEADYVVSEQFSFYSVRLFSDIKG
jgi:hypothetical protein